MDFEDIVPVGCNKNVSKKIFFSSQLDDLYAHDTATLTLIMFMLQII